MPPLVSQVFKLPFCPYISTSGTEHATPTQRPLTTHSGTHLYTQSLDKFFKSPVSYKAQEKRHEKTASTVSCTKTPQIANQDQKDTVLFSCFTDCVRQCSFTRIWYLSAIKQHREKSFEVQCESIVSHVQTTCCHVCGVFYEEYKSAQVLNLWIGHRHYFEFRIRPWMR